MRDILDTIKEQTGLGLTQTITPVTFRREGTFLLEDRGIGTQYVLKPLAWSYLLSVNPGGRTGVVQNLSRLVEEYRHRLNEKGVPIPRQHHVVQHEGMAYEVVPYLGPDLLKWFQTVSLESKKEVVQQLVEICLAVAHDESLGIDMQLENFCVPNGRPVYVDFCPPLVGNPWMAYDILKLSKDCGARQFVEGGWYTPAGPLRRLHRMILRNDRSLEEILWETLRMRWYEGFFFLRSLPLARFRSMDPGAVAEEIKKFGVKEVWQLLDLYAYFLPQEDPLPNFFHQPPNERRPIFVRALRRLCRFLGSASVPIS